MGVVKVTRPIFKLKGSNHITAMGEARHFKFAEPTDVNE